MSILDSFKKQDKPEKKERRAKRIYGSGDSKQRQRKQNISRFSLLNGTTFVVVVKLFSFLLGLAMVALIGYGIYLGIDIFISE